MTGGAGTQHMPCSPALPGVERAGGGAAARRDRERRPPRRRPAPGSSCRAARAARRDRRGTRGLPPAGSGWPRAASCRLPLLGFGRRRRGRQPPQALEQPHARVWEGAEARRRRGRAARRSHARGFLISERDVAVPDRNIGKVKAFRERRQSALQLGLPGRLPHNDSCCLGPRNSSQNVTKGAELFHRLGILFRHSSPDGRARCPGNPPGVRAVAPRRRLLA